MLQILEYKIAASFRSDQDNFVETQKFILLANSLLNGNVKNMELFYESILNILSLYHSDHYCNDLGSAFTPASSLYIASIIQYIERLKEISISQLINEDNNLVSSDYKTDNANLGGVVVENG